MLYPVKSMIFYLKPTKNENIKQVVTSMTKKILFNFKKCYNSLSHDSKMCE